MKRSLILLVLLICSMGLFAKEGITISTDPLELLVNGANNFTIEASLPNSFAGSYSYSTTGATIPDRNGIRTYYTSQTMRVLKYVKGYDQVYFGGLASFATSNIYGADYYNSIYNISAFTAGAECGWKFIKNGCVVTPYALVGYTFTHNFFGEKRGKEVTDNDGNTAELTNFQFGFGFRIGLIK